MALDIYPNPRAFLASVWALGFARIAFAAAFVLLFATPWYWAVSFFALWMLLGLGALSVSFWLRCPACGARQASYSSSPPVRCADGSLRNSVARFFMPDPIALGRFRCWSCKETFALDARHAA